MGTNLAQNIERAS